MWEKDDGLRYSHIKEKENVKFILRHQHTKIELWSWLWNQERKNYHILLLFNDKTPRGLRPFVGPKPRWRFCQVKPNRIPWTWTKKQFLWASPLLYDWLYGKHAKVAMSLVALQVLSVFSNQLGRLRIQGYHPEAADHIAHVWWPMT